jgi:hypothetical protein
MAPWNVCLQSARGCVATLAAEQDRVCANDRAAHLVLDGRVQREHVAHRTHKRERRRAELLRAEVRARQLREAGLWRRGADEHVARDRLRHLEEALEQARGHPRAQVLERGRLGAAVLRDRLRAALCARNLYVGVLYSGACSATQPSGMTLQAHVADEPACEPASLDEQAILT